MRHAGNRLDVSVGLSERIIWIAAAWPMAERHEVDTRDLQGWICLPNSDVRRERVADSADKTKKAAAHAKTSVRRKAGYKPARVGLGN